MQKGKEASAAAREPSAAPGFFQEEFVVRRMRRRLILSRKKKKKKKKKKTVWREENPRNVELEQLWDGEDWAGHPEVPAGPPRRRRSPGLSVCQEHTKHNNLTGIHHP